jgi:hypothetical protein
VRLRKLKGDKQGKCDWVATSSCCRQATAQRSGPDALEELSISIERHHTITPKPQVIRHKTVRFFSDAYFDCFRILPRQNSTLTVGAIYGKTPRHAQEDIATCGLTRRSRDEVAWRPFGAVQYWSVILEQHVGGRHLLGSQGRVVVPFHSTSPGIIPLVAPRRMLNITA